MQPIYAINLIISLVILIILFKGIFKFYNEKDIRILSLLFAFLSCIYAVFISLFILWFLEIIKYNSTDFLYILSFLAAFQSIIFFSISYYFTRNKNNFFFLGIFLLIAFSYFLHLNFSNILISVSFLLILIVFIKFTLDDNYKKIGYAAIVFSSIMLLFQLILIIVLNQPYFFSIIYNIAFLFFLLIFSQQMINKKLKFKEYLPKKQRPYFFNFFQFFIFIVVLTNFIFIGTISVHELGHLAASQFYDCEYRRIVYEKGIPHTDLLCQNLPNKTFLIIGGVLLPFVAALLLFLAGGKFMKETSLLIVGFNLIASYRDFLDLGISENISIFIVFFGIFILILGLALLAKSRTEINYTSF